MNKMIKERKIYSGQWRSTRDFDKIEENNLELYSPEGLEPHLHMVGHRTTTQASKWNLPLHKNSGIELTFIFKGKFDWVVDDKPYSFHSHTCTITLPWQVHGSKNEHHDIGETAWLIIKPEKLTQNGKLVLGDWSSLTEKEQAFIAEKLLYSDKPYIWADSYVFNLYTEIEKECKKNEIWRVTRVNRLLDELLLYIAIHKDDTQKENENLFIEDYIAKIVNKDLAKKWTINEMERISGYKKSRLNSILRKTTGLSTMEYVTRLRVEEAQKLIESTDKSFTSIALEVGFHSSQQFCINFKKYSGYTPTEYKKMHTE